MKTVVAVLLAGIFTEPAWAHEHELFEQECISCEYSRLNTGDASPLGEGAVQLQFNAGYGRSTRQWNTSWSGTGRKRAEEWTIEPVVTVGVRDDLDIGVGFGYAWLEDDQSGLRRGGGLTDLSVSAKWQFYGNRDLGIAMAYLPTLTIPTGEESSASQLGPGQEFWSLDTRFAIVKDWTDRLNSSLDLGYEAAFGDRADYRGSLGSNLAIGYQLFSWLAPELELNVVHDFIAASQDADEIAVTVGGAMPLSEHLCMRAGVQHGIAGRNADQTTSFLLSVDLNF